MKLLCGKLNRIWFLVWFLGISFYLIIKAIRRYLEFKSIQFDNISGRQVDPGIMNFYLTCIIAAIVLAILCVYCTVFQTKNYANDCRQFGHGILDFKVLKSKLQRDQINRHLASDKTCFKSKLLTRIKCHCPPYYLTCYSSMSLILLLALPYLDSEKIKIDIDLPSSPRHTNLDLLFKTDFGNNNKESLSFHSPSFEYFNLCVSLLLHTFSYSQVFWKFSKTFSLTFSVVAFFSGVIFLLDLALIEMLIKQSSVPPQKIYFIAPQAITILSLLAYVMLILHQMSLFEYGFIRIREELVPRYTITIVNNCSTYNDSVNISDQILTVCKQLCVESWSGVLLPFVVGIFSVVLNVCLRISYIYKSMTTIYSQSKDNLVLANLIITIWFLILTMILWVCLLIKSHWPIKTLESVVESNGNCMQYSNSHQHTVPAQPIYASVNRHPLAPPPLTLDNNFTVLTDPRTSQWRYSCSPPSCGANDSNSDRTGSCKNGDTNANNPNYIMVRRGNPTSSHGESPNIGHGIYSQLIKLTPQTSIVENHYTENVTTNNIIPYDISDSSSNQTMRIVNPLTMSIPRGTLERSSARNRNANVSEYFNIVTTHPVTDNEIYDHGASIITDTESTNLCSQV